jgi:DNA-binding IclR family transcriptional regulator
VARAARPASIAASPHDAMGTVARAVAVMRALAEAPNAESIKSLAAKLGLPASTVHRLLHLLIDQGIAQQIDRHAYRVGTEFYRLGALVTDKVRITDVALPFMHEVVKRCDEYCMLCLLLPSERKVIIAETVSSSHPLRYVRDKFMPAPIAWGATGRSILAHLPEAEIRAAHGLAGRSPSTGQALPRYKEFAAELETIREQGYAQTFGQKIPGAVGFGTPVFGSDNSVVASLCVTVPQIRYRAERTHEITGVLMEQARQLSRALGYIAEGERPRLKAGGASS